MDIRKVSIGPDYKNAMTYQVGQKVLDNSNEITLIRKEDTGEIKIYIKNESNETVVWKTLSNEIPVVIEHNINF